MVGGEECAAVSLHIYTESAFVDNDVTAVSWFVVDVEGIGLADFIVVANMLWDDINWALSLVSS